MPNKKQVIVKHTTSDAVNWPSTYLSKHIAELQAYLSTVPEEHQGEVMIRYEAFDAYDSGSVELTISYVRPKTDEELAEEALAEVIEEEKLTAKELLLYKKLKSKFEGANQP
jgi:hypothetical protein